MNTTSVLNTQQRYLQLSLSLKIKQKTLLYSIFCCCWQQQHTPNQPKTVTPKLWYEPNHGFCEPSHPYCWAVVASHYVHPVSLLKVVTQIIPLMYKLEHEQPTDFFRDAEQINIYFYNLHCKCTDHLQVQQQDKTDNVWKTLIELTDSIHFHSISALWWDRKGLKWRRISRTRFLSEHLRKQRTTIYLCFPSLPKSASILECTQVQIQWTVRPSLPVDAPYIFYWIFKNTESCQLRITRYLPTPWVASVSCSSAQVCSLLSFSFLSVCFVCVCVCVHSTVSHSITHQISHLTNTAQHPNPAPQVLRIKANNGKVLSLLYQQLLASVCCNHTKIRKKVLSVAQMIIRAIKWLI